DAEIAAIVEEGDDPVGHRAVEQGAVDVDPEPLRLDRLDRLDGAVEHAVLADRMVVLFLQPVEMDRESEVGARREEVDLLFEQQRVGAEIDEALALDDAFDDLADLLVQQRLTAGNRYDRGAAFVDRPEAFGDAE